MTEDYYALLGVDPDASEDAILHAYREKAAEHHPDVSDDADAGETFQRLKRAREVLTDAERRRRYDRLGHDRFVDEADGTAAGETTGRGERSATRPPPRARAGSVHGIGPPFAIDLQSLFERAARWNAAARAGRPPGDGGSARPCPKCGGRGSFVHVLDTGRGRRRRVERCERCEGSGTAEA
jgi:molecular chaperone DnaJ